MKTKILGLTLGITALALFASATNASTAEMIQPASIVYNENMTVNGSLQVSSLRVGYEGVGGVTYFNGTIINVGPQIPVTIGDDLRIDGEIWRGPSKGQADGQPLKFSDSLTPTDTNAYNLGFDDKRWKDLYLAGYLYGEDFMVGREIWGGTKKGIIDGDDPLFVSDSMYPTKDDINNLGSANKRWNDLYLSGMLQGVDVELSGSLQGNNAKFSGLLEGNDVKFTGDVDFSEATVTGLSTGDYYTKAQSDGRYLQLTGGVLTGNLAVNGVSGLADADIPDNITVSQYLPLAGGTMSGDIEMGNHSLNDVNTIDVNASIDAQTIIGSNYSIGKVQSDNSSVVGTLTILPYNSAPYTCADNFTKGMLWFDDSTDKLRVCDGSSWVVLH